MKACPYRSDFYKKLGPDQAVVKEEMETWLSSLESIVKEMQSLYATKDYGGQIAFQ
jgi:hypothetical protein